MWFPNYGSLELCVVILMIMIANIECRQKPINVALDGKWSSTPLLLETSEFLAKESNEHFWSFADRISEQDLDFFELASDEIKYLFAQKYAAEVLSPLQLSFLKISLSLRAFSPNIQMYQQLAQQVNPNKECATFIDVNGEFTCDPNSLSELLTTSSKRTPSPVYQFDHVHTKSTQKGGPVVILYTEMATKGFKSFHPALATLAKKGEITYCLRHFIKDTESKRVRLSGYGVELAIKSTEYKAKDDTKVEGSASEGAADEDDEGEDVQGVVFSKLRDLHPELKKELKEFKSFLMDSATELTPFKVWQLQDLSIQAAQKIVSAPTENALQYLRDISQNFPTQARSLVQTQVSADFRKELKNNQKIFEANNIGAGDSLLYINGLSVDMEIYDIFTLLDLMTSEAGLVEGLHSLGFSGDNLQQFLQLDMKEGGEQSYAVDIRHSAIQYLNDLATDKRYRGWPSSVQDLLRPTFPGMLRHMAKNIFHLIFVVDPSNPNSKSLLNMAEAFYVHKAPLRLGLVLVTDGDKKANGFSSPGVALARAFNFVSMDKSSPAKGLSFITDVYQKTMSGELTSEAIIAEFSRQYPDEDKEMVFGDNEDYDDVRKAGMDFVSRTGLADFPQVLINGVPLEKEHVSSDSFEEGVVMEVLKQTQIIQSAVYKGEVTDRMDILDWWMERDNVLPRLNSRVLAPPNFRLDFTGSFGKEVELTNAAASELDSKSLTAGIADSLNYVTKKDDASAVQAVTMWIVADPETPQGRELMFNSLKHLRTSSDLRLAFVLNPTNPKGNNYVSKAIQVALKTLSMPHAKSLVNKLVKEENAVALNAGTKTLEDLEVHGMDIQAYMKALAAETGNLLQVHRTFASKVLSLRSGERAVITNGAFLGPMAKGQEFSVEDLNLVEKLASQQGGKKIREALQESDGSKKSSDSVMKVAGLLLSRGKTGKRQKLEYSGDKFSAIKVPAVPDVPAFTVDAVVDPASREAQKMAPILMVLKEIANVDIRIFMNPKEKLSEMPLKSFYRYVLEPEVTFDTEGMVSDGPAARFLDMPQKSLLTLAMDTPEGWLVEAVTSPYDLDNILLEEVEKTVSAQFELEYLLLEGHCHDATSMQPPRGLQFVLGTSNEPAMVDTIVMANLGYFQLKANPGLWQLQLRDGRSKDIYNIDSHENTDSLENSSSIIVAISSFKSKIIKVKVAKKPEKAEVNLLQDDEEENGGIWDSISNTITGSSKKKDEEADSTLNIFSVASGHLYERFLRIMMLSVLKNTQSKVKFWFLKNYLSPSFKDFIPYMAQEYGFEYELVQYKWPRWLNQQKEKQRIIWGYKILFLDVLFPLDVKKFIFVDADQIVRADLQELHDLDLKGAPYGYTPFCDSRKEMEGFRFWNSGYWRSHLAGRKYHISALYVVDLKKFRRIAAGDRLRGQYQGLSQDPNSLANLDQDLPNNMIHQVAIKSLPQEWLYCETWCSEHEKANAKTIDLCNNPLTKEPKLQAAMRIVPEWKDYDYEVKVLWDDIYQTNTKTQIEYEPPQVFKKPTGKKRDEL